MAEHADGPLYPELFVPWRELTRHEIEAFETALNEARVEADMQRFLEAHPRILIQHLPVGRGAFVIPKKRLGSEYETDFLIAQEAEGGLVWTALELERPQAILFTQKGDPSAEQTHAVRQINDWRDWLSRNRDYAARSREASGLGLTDIDPELPGLIIMGRDSTSDKRTAARRRRLGRDSRIQLETYDWLIAQARERLERRQTDIVRVANDIAKWREIASLVEGPVGGPVIEVLLTNIEPREAKDIAWIPASAISTDIPQEYDDLIAAVKEILAEVNSELKKIYYHTVTDYIELIPSGYMSSAHAERIYRTGRISPVKYMMTALVYEPSVELLSRDPNWRIGHS